MMVGCNTGLGVIRRTNADFLV